jgi:hypothetical protein
MNMTLEEIFVAQITLMEAMGWPAGAPDSAKCGGNQDAAKAHLLAAIHECTEAMNELNWKPWKKNRKIVDRDAFATELMDIVQLVVNAALVMGYTNEDLAKALRVKWAVNFQRIDAGEVTSVGTGKA